MRSKYGAPGQTDREGFDPYADRVGPGIYGGHVKRDECGRVIYGEQYQNHNPRPGPVYAGGGYTPIVQALGLGQKALEELLDACPEAVNEVSTGGATPLHMAGMSKRNQEMTEILIRRGGNMYVRREEGERENGGIAKVLTCTPIPSRAYVYNPHIHISVRPWILMAIVRSIVWPAIIWLWAQKRFSRPGLTLKLSPGLGKV